MPLISFVFSSWIINEYYKYICIYQDDLPSSEALTLCICTGIYLYAKQLKKWFAIDSIVLNTFKVAPFSFFIHALFHTVII